jgi:hypothetical protein
MPDEELHRRMLEEIRLEMSKTAERMVQLRAAAAYHAEKIGEDLPEDGSRGVTGVQDSNRGAGSTRRHAEFANLKMKHAAQIVLRKAGRHLPTAEIADALLKGGYPAKNPPGFRNVVFAMLRKTPALFRRVDKGLWAITEAEENGQ